ncbi:MAG: PQQ-binding-like beta-propeller repeat protein [Alphaproteobacteria bacterium]|nr:PQQ-binding-like beta-propeller repeat protein [Alphaproteobacteria bacterium]
MLVANVAGLGLAAAALADPAADWPTYGRDKGGQRHSPLAQITPANVAGLELAWTYHMRPASLDAAPADAAAAAQRSAEGVGGPPPGAPAGGAFSRQRSRFAGSQSTPLVVDGVMYTTTPYGRVVALEPETGRELWAAAIPGPGQPSLRGVEYWPGDGDTPPRLFFGTRDGRLFALDAASGKPAAGFGQNGVVEMKTPDVLNGQTVRQYGMTSPPIVWKNLVITGSAVQEFPPRGAAGDVRAWDARTGALVWTFHSVPRPGEPFHETWGTDGAAARSGVNVWGFLTLDAARGIVYMPFAAPSFDRFGGDRPGDNLYSSTLVAADAATGKRLWHFQVVRHDIWDNDLQAPPILFDVEKGKRRIPAVAIVSKNGLVFILDRVTGKPVFPVKDMPFPASPVPGEVTAPTQPIPQVTPPLSRTSFTMADVADVTPELKAGCTDWITRNAMVPGGLYVPVGFNTVTISFPGLQGGGNWGGFTYAADRRHLIVNTTELGQVTALVPSKGPLPVERGPVSGRFQLPGSKLMCQQPPWGKLSAIDTRTGKLAWTVPLGVTDELPEGKRLTGRPNIGGPISTASGLTFIGASDDGRFRAFDSANGKLLWEVKLPAAAHATPATYRGKDGRQYVVVTATGGSFLDSPLASDVVMAFALPR